MVLFLHEKQNTKVVLKCFGLFIKANCIYLYIYIYKEMKNFCDFIEKKLQYKLKENKSKKKQTKKH